MANKAVNADAQVRPLPSVAPVLVRRFSTLSRASGVRVSTMRVTAALILACCSVTASGQTAHDGYVGVLTESAKRKVGEQFTFANLRTPHPFVTYPSGYGGEFTKVYEDQNMIVLFFVGSATGSTETYYLNKSKGIFTVVEVGVLESVGNGKPPRADVSQGTLR
jgi:hypothetical protein